MSGSASNFHKLKKLYILQVLETAGRLGKIGMDNKRGGSINRGGRKYFVERIVGEALIRLSRGEKPFQINRRASPAIK